MLKNRFLIYAMIFAFLNALAISFIFGFKHYGDTVVFLDAIDWFKGKIDASYLRPYHGLRPLGTFLALPFEFLGPGAGLVVQNFVFYFLAVFFIFEITEIVFNDPKKSFLASVFFASATPVLDVGLAYLTDMGAWCFYIFSLFLTLLFFQKRNDKLIFLNGLVSGIGFLIKENAALGICFFVFMILLSNEFNLKEKIKKIFKFVFPFLIPVIILQIVVYNIFGSTSYDWIASRAPTKIGESFIVTSLRYLGQLFRILGLIWPFILLGLWRELKEKNAFRMKVFLALIPSSFSFLLWTTSAGARTVFIFAPLGILLAVKGISFFESLLSERFKKPAVVLVLSLFIISNYCFSLINPNIAFVDMVAGFLGL